MKKDCLRWFVCSSRGNSDLALQDEKHTGNAEEVVTGSLRCQYCNAVCPIIGNITRFVLPDNYAGSFGYQSNIHGQTQLDSHSRLNISRDRVFAVTGWPELPVYADLDTFDMYSPAHDHPRSLAAVRGWFERVEVRRGPNGVVGRGVRPLLMSAQLGLSKNS